VTDAAALNPSPLVGEVAGQGPAGGGRTEGAEPSPTTDEAFDWAVVEIFGHRRHAGRIREEERFGARMLRVDVPTVGSDGQPSAWVTHWYGGSAIFSLTTTDEATVLRANRPFDLPGRYLPPPTRDTDLGDDDSGVDE